MMGTGSVTAQNMALQEANGGGYNWRTPYTNILQVPFSACGTDMVRDEYNSLSMPSDVCYSVGGWFSVSQMYPTNSDPYCFIFGYAPYGSGKHFNQASAHWGLYTTSSNKYLFHVGSNAGGVLENNDIELGTFAANTYHYGLVAIDNKNMKVTIYIDGEQVCDQEINVPIYAQGANTAFMFGQYGVYGMDVDEFQIFGSALTPDEAAKAYTNAATVASVSSIFTCNKIKAGTIGTFVNDMIGGASDDAVFTYHKFGGHWVDGALVNWETMNEAEATLVEGRDISNMYTTVKVNTPQNGTLTVTAADGTVLSNGNNSVAAQTYYTVSAAPAEGYALVGIFAKNVKGETVLVNNSEVCVLGSTQFTARFSNEFNEVTFEAEHPVPFVIYHNGTQVGTSEDDHLNAIKGETYKLVFDVPFNLILNSITVDGEEIAVVDNACEFTVAENTNKVVINVNEKESYVVTINQPMVDGEAAGTVTVTGFAGEIANGEKAVVGDELTVSFTPAEGYRFRHYIINDELTAANTIVVEDAVSFGVDAEKGNEYPAMTHAYTNGTTQQNRLMKSMKQVGTDGYLFNAETQDELGFTYYPGPTGTFLPDGAIVNKTGIRAGHFQIDQATESFAFVFTPWADQLITPEGALNTEFGWTKYAVYVDWNNDGDFTDEGEIAAVDNVGCSSAKYNNEDNCTKTVTVPAGLAMGTYRMRIVFYEPGADNWYETLFDDCQIRNGVAYDFDIDVASSRLESPRTVTIASNFEKAGSVKFGELDSEAKVDGLSVTTDYKYVPVVAEAAENASFLYWTDAQNIQISSDAAFRFAGTEDATITANFGYVVSTEAEGEGRLSIASNGENYPTGSVIVAGQEVTVTPVADQGYELTGLTLNDEAVEVAEDGTYTFTLDGPATLKATFGVHTYTVTYAASGQGTLTVGAGYDEATNVVTDDVENGAEVTDDNLFFCVAKANGTDIIHWIKYTIDGVETVVYDKDGDSDVEISNVYSDDADAWFIGTNGIGFAVYGALADYVITADFSGNGSGINGVELDAANGVVEYYNLQGVKVAAENLAPGFYIARQGNKAVKVLINK